MGSMSSPSQAIYNLHFNPLPKKPIAGTIVQVGSTIVMKGERGSLYTNTVVRKKVHCSGNWDWSEDITEALDLLGVLTPEDKALHTTWLAELDKRDELVREFGEVFDAAKHKSSGISNKRLLALWNKLDYRGQMEVKRYRQMPAGAVMKAEPK